MTKRAAAIAFVLVAAIAHLACRSQARGTPAITVKHCRAQVFPNGKGAAYCDIANDGTADDRLQSAASEKVQRVELHNIVTEGDVSRMLEMPDGIVIPAGATVALRPGGFHLMLAGIALPSAEGSIALTFKFANSRDLTALASITAPEPTR